MIKIVTVIGARPQFIKAAAISRAIRSKYFDKITEVLVHTGQHYDPNMSSVFFEELDIPAPAYNLEISGGTHGAMTGKMLESIENVLLAEKPDWVLVYGDTNSTLAAALAAAKLHIPIAHVEAGLRSFNMNMPEEVNRIVADRLSRKTFCPTQIAVENLHHEGIRSGVHLVGDVMYDVSLYYRDIARNKSNALERLGLEDGHYVLATCHRAENTDSPSRLTSIVQGLSDLASQIPVVLPLHPRTRKKIEDLNLTTDLLNITVVEPLPFLDMIRLEQAARLIVTDSGGVQKEAFFYEIPCVTMRDETEWTETVELGLNVLVGADRNLIANSLSRKRADGKLPQPYGNGNASEAILEEMLRAP